MKKSDLELLQPVQWHDVQGYINFICEDYLTICFIDEPLPTSANSRWGRHYAAILVYRNSWHEIRCRVDEEKNKRRRHRPPRPAARRGSRPQREAAAAPPPPPPALRHGGGRRRHVRRRRRPSPSTEAPTRATAAAAGAAASEEVEMDVDAAGAVRAGVER